MIALRFPGGTASPKDFNEWLNKAAPGDACEYFRGDLATASGYDQALKILASVVRNSASAWSKRDIVLFQERIGAGCFRYIAMRVSRDCFVRLLTPPERARNVSVLPPLRTVRVATRSAS